MFETKPNRFRSRPLSTLVASIGAMGVSTTASATVVSDLISTHSPNETFSLNNIGILGEIKLQSMGMDLFLEASMGMMDNPSSTVRFDATLGSGSMPSSFLDLHELGDTVDGMLAFESRGDLIKSGATSEEWPIGTTGYAGFSFQPDSTVLYGWMKIDFVSQTEFTVTQWAYEDTGDPIVIIEVIPEPSTGLLLGLGLAGLAAVIRKMGRRETKGEDPALEAG